MIKNKKIVIFDGDGTLWYPKSTKWSKKPNWIYWDNPEAKDYLKHLRLTPNLIPVLKKLKQRGMILVALSTHPHTRMEADVRMGQKMKHLKLDSIFDHVYTARPFPWGKGRVMASLLKKNGIPKSRALLVGDSHTYDYLSAKGVGVDCVLIKTPYLGVIDKKVKTIKSLRELVAI